MDRTHELVAAAIRVAGGTTAVSRVLGISPGSVRRWYYRQVPANRVMALERLTGGRYKCYEIRPDIFPPQEYAVRSSAEARKEPGFETYQEELHRTKPLASR